MSRKPEQRFKTRRYPTPALEKGLDILELFARQPGGLTKSEVARQLGRTVSEIFRMLLCLEERGYISRTDGHDRFCLTLHLFKLAQEYPPTNRLATEALPIMQEVVHRLNQSCHLGVLDEGHVVIVAQADSPVSPGFYVKAGSVIDLMEAATGHVILAHQTPEVRNRAIAIWQRQTRSSVPRDLQQHLAKIKRQGFEERNSYQVSGVINISFPILDERGNALAALTVPYVRFIGDSTTTKTAKSVLRDSSIRLSKALGGVGEASELKRRLS